MEGRLVLLVGCGQPQVALAGLLEARGYRTLRTEGAEEGIDLARELKPDVVLTELYVPDERGLCVAEILKRDEETAGIRVVVWTSRAFPEHRERATRAAADAFVPMPATIDELVATVERLAGAAWSGAGGRPDAPAQQAYVQRAPASRSSAREASASRTPAPERT